MTRIPSKGRKRVLKVCPNCGSTSVKPAKVLDEWASIEEQMDSSGGDKYECAECGYRGELIGMQEPDDEPHEEEKEELEKDADEAPQKQAMAPKPKKTTGKKNGKLPKNKKGRKK